MVIGTEGKTMKPQFLPRQMWHTKLRCVVDLQKRGHFEIGTLLAKLPNDKLIEVYIDDLEDYDQVISRVTASEVGE
jgi:hypothetical protein